MRKFINQFGAKPTKEDLQRYAQSENWKNGKFQNFEAIKMVTNPLEIGKILCIIIETARPHEYRIQT